jgi:hypothetical protein
MSRRSGYRTGREKSGTVTAPVRAKCASRLPTNEKPVNVIMAADLQIEL